MVNQKFYDQVAQEIAAQQLDNGLWVRAFSEALGDEGRAKAIYISLRVARLEADEAQRRAAAAAEQEQCARAAKERAEAKAKERAEAEVKEREAWEREAKKRYKAFQDPLNYAMAVVVLYVVVLIFIYTCYGT